MEAKLILKDLKPYMAPPVFPDVFKWELGCLKDFQLEIQFKPASKPIFCKPCGVLFAIHDDLMLAGMAKGVGKPTQFNSYGTPVVPIRKKATAGGSISVCGDYSVMVNPQLEPHRYATPRWPDAKV